MISNCSLGDDNVTSYEDICSFTCNTGYELSDRDTRICQSNGNWSGNNATCTRGTYNQIVNTLLHIYMYVCIYYMYIATVHPQYVRMCFRNYVCSYGMHVHNQ